METIYHSQWLFGLFSFVFSANKRSKYMKIVRALTLYILKFLNSARTRPGNAEKNFRFPRFSNGRSFFLFLYLWENLNQKF